VRHAALILILLLGATAEAQLKRDRSRECVICHVTWGEGFEQMADKLRPVDHPVRIDGQLARVSSVDMCWSCHDGYVVDSRERFLENDPHMQPPSEGMNVAASGLRLSEEGRMYCGTCHTPHTMEMERSYAFSPFLRQETAQSEICVACHADHAEPGSSHPIHVAQPTTMPAILGSKRTPEGTVECLTCHDMHDRRTAKLTDGHDRSRLCRSCHEPQFALLDSDHELNRMRPELLVGETGLRAGEMDACGACHLTHGAQGASLWSWPLPEGRASDPIVAGVDSRCLSCHREDGPAADKAWLGHGHPVEARVEACDSPELLLDPEGGMSCRTCHDPHRWSVLAGREPGPGDDEGDALTSFLRLPDDENSRLCTSCHREQAQSLVSDHNSFSWSDPSTGQCSGCHETHQETPFVDGHARRDLSAFSSLCVHCHEGEGLHGATPLGEHGHPIGVVQPTESGLPTMEAHHFTALHLAPDETVPGRVGCESCHDPHRWSPVGEDWLGAGSRGSEASSFLRIDNRRADLCAACHQDELMVLGSGHDLAEQRPGRSPCTACHTTHRAVSDWAIIASSLSDAEMDSLTLLAGGPLERNAANWSPGARHCLSCHHEGGGSVVVPVAWGHPQDVETLAGPWRADGRTMPLFDEEGRTGTPLGRVDCTSCHNPHLAHPLDATEHATDFLRGPSHGTVCADCHGPSALWKYRYYHHPEKRELP
jgi:predicted CXXCH cytochrome family protein